MAEHDPVTQASIDYIAKEIREAIGPARPGLTLDTIRESAEEALSALYGEVLVEVDAENPDIINVSYRPKSIIITLEIET